jgi:hypothetical protein
LKDRSRAKEAQETQMRYIDLRAQLPSRLGEWRTTMADNRIEKIIRDAVDLPPEEQQRLIQVLTERLSQPTAKKTIEQIASEQGKEPLRFSEIQELGSFFPEEESVDDLISTIRTLREDKSARDIG